MRILLITLLFSLTISTVAQAQYSDGRLQFQGKVRGRLQGDIGFAGASALPADTRGLPRYGGYAFDPCVPQGRAIEPRAVCPDYGARSAPQVVCEPPLARAPLETREVNSCLTLVELARIGAAIEAIRGEQRYGTFALERIVGQGDTAAQIALINAIREREPRADGQIDPVLALILQKLQERCAPPQPPPVIPAPTQVLPLQVVPVPASRNQCSGITRETTEMVRKAIRHHHRCQSNRIGRGLVSVLITFAARGRSHVSVSVRHCVAVSGTARTSRWEATNSGTASTCDELCT